MTTRVSLLDDFPVVRNAIAAGLADDPRTQVATVAADARGLLDALVMDRCDVVLLDVHLHDTDGISLIARIRRLHAHVRVLVLSSVEREQVVRSALHAGASGYLVKRQTLGEIIDGVCAVHAGGTVLAPQVARWLVPDAASTGRDGIPVKRELPLAPSELDVLRLVVHGATDMQIARALYVSPRTVQYQLARIRSKAGVHRRAELAHWAHENSLV